MSQAVSKFIDQYTRSLLVEWAAFQVTEGYLPSLTTPNKKPFVDFAVEKGWISKDRSRMLASGFTTAASFLKR